jgi:hypothetical protein
VLVGTVLTAYQAAGTGAPLVVLGGAGVAPLAELGAVARVTVPEMTAVEAGGQAFTAWLRDFLDALGVGETKLLAFPPYALSTLAFTVLEPARVRRAALVCWDHGDPAAPAGAVADELAASGTPLLLARLDTAGTIPPPVGAQILHFLADGG